MIARGPAICYIGSSLPKRSETFVYRELFGLRQAGYEVAAATVHAPDSGLGEDRLDILAAEAVGIYGPGVFPLVLDSLGACIAYPKQVLWTLGRALVDMAVELGRKGPAAALRVGVQYLAACALAQRLRCRGIVHIHAHMAHVPTTIAMYAASVLGCSFSFTGHAADLFRDRSLLPEKLRRASFVCCISLWHREFYSGMVERSDVEYPVVRCGVDAETSASAGDRVPGTSFRIVSIGRLVPKKGFDLLIEAAEYLSRSGLAVSVLIAGDGPEEQRLQQRALESPIAADICFAGSVDNCAVPAILASADCFVLACRTSDDGDRDGIPVVLMEAMAAGIPVVSGDLPSIRELISDGVSGLLVRPENTANLAGAIRHIADDTEFAQSLARNGILRVQSEFSAAINIQRLVSIYISMGIHARDAV